MGRAKPAGAGLLLVAAATLLGSCGSSKTSALVLASSHPDTLAAARYVAVRAGDLPDGFRSHAVSARDAALDASQTLAEYACEKLRPPSQKASATASTPDWSNSTGTIELRETTAVFGSDAAAAAHLQLERNSRYPACKASAFGRSLAAAAPKGARVGPVDVAISDVPMRYGDSGVEATGVCDVELPGGVSEVATAELVVLVREHLVVELTIGTDGPDPKALVSALTTDLAGRLAQVLPAPKR